MLFCVKCLNKPKAGCNESQKHQYETYGISPNIMSFNAIYTTINNN